jgi:PAS domain S-box-containing protein
MEKKEALKELIRNLHDGANPDRVKDEFRELLRDVTPPEIARVEEELIQEGMPREEIHRLCDVHLAVFRESLQAEEGLAPAGHPVHILMAEHNALLDIAGELACIVQDAHDGRFDGEQVAQLASVKADLQASESHYVREENVLFPYLEKHGVTQPPAIMWMEHDRIREVKKAVYALVDDAGRESGADFVGHLREVAVTLNELLHDHFQKENRILFPTALRVMGDEEWVDVRRQFDELGYCPFTPQQALAAFGEDRLPASAAETAGQVVFGTGAFAPVELEALLNTLPVEITFVDAEDTVRYFNETAERIFPRTRAAIGRQVQMCHPQKSLHLVNRIVQDFRSGRRDVSEFWIQMQGKFVHIRYLAVRDPAGRYLGALEVVQDVTHIRALEGERRLLAEETT